MSFASSALLKVLGHGAAALLTQALQGAHGEAPLLLAAAADVDDDHLVAHLEVLGVGSGNDEYLWLI